jgi:hypothetical protein
MEIAVLGEFDEDHRGTARDHCLAMDELEVV